MGLFDKLARNRHKNTENDTPSASSATPAKKVEPPSPPLDSEARIAYQQGFDCYRKGEYEEAARLYRISADLGFFRAQYALALFYMEGWGVEKDLTEAEMWVQKAADQGDESAANLVKEIQEKRSTASESHALGLNFYEQEDYEQAVRHFRTAANADHAGAQGCLAVCYATGKGVEKDLDTAELWARQALESGHDEAAELLDAIHEEQRDEAFELGVSCYEQGDYTQAFQYFHTAAQQGLPNAQFNLAVCYFRGEGVEKNLDAATTWAERAYDQNFEAAAELLKLLKTTKAHAFDVGVAFLEKNDFVQAVLFFRIAAEQGNAKAQFNLALCYSKGKGVEENQSEAARWYRAAAEQGYASAQFNLALCYSQGKGVEENQSEAARWYLKAAQQGNVDAQFNLALRYEKGNGVAQDLQEAARWYRAAVEQGDQKAAEALERLRKKEAKDAFFLGIACYEKSEYTQAVQHFHTAAELGVAEAQYNLAICYGRGEGVEKNLDTAIMWAERAREQDYEDVKELLFILKLQREKAKPHFLIAAERGDANAQFALALRYADGDGVEQDQSKAVHWYQKAAEQGHAKAQFNLAVRYENGNGIERDQTKAVRWYLKAAQQGHSGAQFNLALCYKDGDGVQEDQWKASHWFHMAAEQGDAVAQFNLAVRYEEGKGIHQNQSEAIRWYRTAAHQGYANAQNNLAICYEQGRGVTQDQHEAVRWYLKAAQQGHTSAQFNLALCYINGDGVEPNMSEAIYWYQKAAEQGHTTAQFNLAVRYENGDGVEKNQSEAVRWYRAAAEQGYASAQYNLSICYRDGDGVAVDLDEAELWAQKAAQQGHESAPKLLEGIRQRKNNR